jgi:hypothetical protein
LYTAPLPQRPTYPVFIEIGYYKASYDTFDGKCVTLRHHVTL